MGFLESQGQGLPSLLLLYGLGKLAALKAVAPGQVLGGRDLGRNDEHGGAAHGAVLRAARISSPGRSRWEMDGQWTLWTFLRVQWIGNVPNGVVALVQAIDEGDIRKFTESLAQVVTGRGLRP